MHGLVNRSIQRYICDSHGLVPWSEITREAGMDFTNFEGMLTYKHVYTPKILDAASRILKRSRAEILEDFGTYLVSHPDFENIRRLLRFGGVDFVDFLHSLDELPDRARLAVADLILPKIELHAHSEEHYRLVCDAQIEGYGFVLMGILRVMADDYGALVVLDHEGNIAGVETISITLVLSDFAEGRSFELSRAAT
ncbi:MAG: heme NO-binding domain-containing protein [Pseudomonadota bacterium]